MVVVCRVTHRKPCLLLKVILKGLNYRGDLCRPRGSKTREPLPVPFMRPGRYRLCVPEWLEEPFAGTVYAWISP